MINFFSFANIIFMLVAKSGQGCLLHCYSISCDEYAYLNWIETSAVFFQNRAVMNYEKSCHDIFFQHHFHIFQSIS